MIMVTIESLYFKALSSVTVKILKGGSSLALQLRREAQMVSPAMGAAMIGKNDDKYSISRLWSL